MAMQSSDVPPCVLWADRTALAERASQLNLAVPEAILDDPLPKKVTPGQPCAENETALLDMLRRAIDEVRRGEFSALVTGPVHKAVFSHSNHLGMTEFIAEYCGCKDEPVMFMVHEHLRVALVTTHIPLHAVPQAITAERLRRTCLATDEALRRWFGIKKPRLGICGLNPHAGEEGLLGDEEQKILIPTLAKLRQEGLHVSAPLPADSLFSPENAQKFDALVALYHDQGLAPIKALGFGKTVNLTLGIPLLRCAVDHGTAFDLAGTGQAKPDSLITALDLAFHLAVHLPYGLPSPDP